MVRADVAMVQCKLVRCAPRAVDGGQKSALTSCSWPPSRRGMNHAGRISFRIMCWIVDMTWRISSPRRCSSLGLEVGW